MDTVQDTARPAFLKRPDQDATPPAKPQPPVGVPAEYVSELLGSFRREIDPHLPAELPEAHSDAINDLVGGLFEKHVEPLEFPTVTPAMAYVSWRAMRTAGECYALDSVSHAMIVHASEKMASIISRSRKIRCKSDLLARLDWLTADIEEFSRDDISEHAWAALKQIRRDVYFLVEDSAVHDSTAQPNPYATGPTVGELDAVVKAFAKVGLGPDAAYDAIGLTREQVEA